MGVNVFTTEQLARLNQPLDPTRVAKRQGGGGMSLSYLEGYDVINTANEVFGYGGWGMDVQRVDPVGDGKYLAVVRVTVFGPDSGAAVSRTDVGFGAARNDSPDEHDKAVKTAVTDGMKRAFRTFGNQFGNSLYDKNDAAHGAVRTNGQRASAGNSAGRTASTASGQAVASAGNRGGAGSGGGDGDNLICVGCGKPGSEWWKPTKRDGGQWTAAQRARFNAQDLNGLSPVCDTCKGKHKKGQVDLFAGSDLTGNNNGDTGDYLDDVPF